MLKEEDAWDRLFAALEELADEARRAKIQIAIEAEPGDLCLVSDERTLFKLCDLLTTRYSHLRDVVCINLDIAHWSLGGLSPTPPGRIAGLMRRTAHAHVSDFAVGHLGDLAVGVNHSAEFFRSWLDLIEAAPGFNRSIALELDACKSQICLIRSVPRLKRLGVNFD